MEMFRSHLNCLVNQCTGIQYINPEGTIAEIISSSRVSLADAKSYLEKKGYYPEYTPVKDIPGLFNLCVDVSDSDLIKDGNKYKVNRLPKYNHSRLCGAIEYVERYTISNTIGKFFESLDTNPRLRYVSISFDSHMQAMLFLNTWNTVFSGDSSLYNCFRLTENQLDGYFKY